MTTWVVAVAIFIANAFASPYFLDPWNLSDASFNFTEKALIAFAMAMLIIAGEIDLSVASIIALASTMMGYCMVLGAPSAVRSAFISFSTVNHALLPSPDCNTVV